MRYKVSALFWGYNKPTHFTAKNKTERDLIIKDLMNDYAVCVIEYAKLHKDNTIGEYKTVFEEVL